MLGMMIWKTPEKREKAVTIREQMVLHVRFTCAEVANGKWMPEAALRRRVRGAARRLKKLGVTEVVTPENFSFGDVLEQVGVRVISTLALRRMIAADWLRIELMAHGITGTGIRVAVAAEELTGELVRTVTELALRYRYVLLDVRRGGEELCRHLRREYGVALQLTPSAEQVRQAQAVLLFAKRPEWDEKNPVVLRLWGEEDPLPTLALPPALEAQLPAGPDRSQLLAAFRQAGVLRPGQLTVERKPALQSDGQLSVRCGETDGNRTEVSTNALGTALDISKVTPYNTKL